MATGQETEVLKIQKKSNMLHCPSQATTVAKKATRQTNVIQKTNTRAVADALEVKVEDALAERINVDVDADVTEEVTTRKATTQVYCASSAEKGALCP